MLDSLEYIFCPRHAYIFNHFCVIGTKAAEFCRITQNNDHCAVQGHLRSPVTIPVESPFAGALLLVISTNLCPISQRFPVIADYWSNLPDSTWNRNPKFNNVYHPQRPESHDVWKLRYLVIDIWKLTTLLSDNIFERHSVVLSQT